MGNGGGGVALPPLGDLFGDAKDTLADWGTQLGAGLDTAKEAFDSWAKDHQDELDAAKEQLKDWAAGDQLKDLAKDHGDALKDFGKDIKDSLKDFGKGLKGRRALCGNKGHMGKGGCERKCERLLETMAETCLAPVPPPPMLLPADLAAVVPHHGGGHRGKGHHGKGHRGGHRGGHHRGGHRGFPDFGEAEAAFVALVHNGQCRDAQFAEAAVKAGVASARAAATAVAQAANPGGAAGGAVAAGDDYAAEEEEQGNDAPTPITEQPWFMGAAIGGGCALVGIAALLTVLHQRRQKTRLESAAGSNGEDGRRLSWSDGNRVHGSSVTGLSSTVNVVGAPSFV